MDDVGRCATGVEVAAKKGEETDSLRLDDLS